MSTLTIPDEMDKRLSNLAEKYGRSKEDFFLRIFEEALEDYEDLLIAEESWERIEKGIEETISFEDIIKKYGLDE